MTVTNAQSSSRSTTIGGVVLSLFAVLAATVVAALISPVDLPSLFASLADPAEHAYWYLSRGSGIMAYLIIWLSTALGLMVTNKLARLWPGGPTTVDLHEFTGLLGMAFSVFHVLILLGDHYIGYTLNQLLIPFASTDYRPLWIGLGQLGLYLGIPVTFAFYVRRHIGPLWRTLHYGSFVMFALLALHGLMSGTDSTQPAVQAMYWVTAASVVGLTVYRVWVSRKQTARAPGRAEAHPSPAARG